ncbi:hypothetical protein EYR40_010605 [Pleurotus pulmonarius]|nr:hypothetical protein EYR40_010605 [Pleurotus pulmonarius]
MILHNADHINEFRRLRAEFWNIPGVYEELQAYETRDDNYKYQILKGLVPAPLVGSVTTEVGPAWRTSDTFFTDFPDHNVPKRVLSSTKDSHIICNVACHDTRLYASDIDPSSSDKTAAAGMSYMHLLGRQCDPRHDGKAVHRSGSRLSSSRQLNSTSTHGASRCRDERVQELCRRLRKYAADDLEHVGHLHMHVLLDDAEFRTHSTLAHDWKTLSFEAVEHVLGEVAESTIPGGWPMQSDR